MKTKIKIKTTLYGKRHITRNKIPDQVQLTVSALYFFMVLLTSVNKLVMENEQPVALKKKEKKRFIIRSIPFGIVMLNCVNKLVRKFCNCVDNSTCHVFQFKIKKFYSVICFVFAIFFYCSQFILEFNLRNKTKLCCLFGCCGAIFGTNNFVYFVLFLF